jgi:hypothetical protein
MKGGCEGDGTVVLEYLVEEGGPVANSTKEAAEVDVIEAVGCESPFFLSVIEFESEVWWNEGWLGGGEVGANDFGGGKLVCKVAVWC